MCYGQTLLIKLLQPWFWYQSRYRTNRIDSNQVVTFEILVQRHMLVLVRGTVCFQAWHVFPDTVVLFVPLYSVPSTVSLHSMSAQMDILDYTNTYKECYSSKFAIFNFSDDIMICKRQRCLMWNQLKSTGIEILETTTCLIFFHHILSYHRMVSHTCDTSCRDRWCSTRDLLCDQAADFCSSLRPLNDRNRELITF